MRNKPVKVIAECAIMLALAFALSYAKLFEMPMGGSVTLASMLPIMLISIKYGNLIGISCAFLYSGMQLLQAFMQGNVFIYCQTAPTFITCMLFDYIVPFTVLGLAGIFKNMKAFKRKELGAYIGIVAVVLLRFISHYVTGVTIWGQWAEGMSKYLYSFLYNGGFLSLDFAICIACAVLMMRSSEIRKLIAMPKKRKI